MVQWRWSHAEVVVVSSEFENGKLDSQAQVSDGDSSKTTEVIVKGSDTSSSNESSGDFCSLTFDVLMQLFNFHSYINIV